MFIFFFFFLNFSSNLPKKLFEINNVYDKEKKKKKNYQHTSVHLIG